MDRAAAHRRTVRRWLLALVMLAVVSEGLLITPLRVHAGSNIVALELAPSAAAFAERVRVDWTQDARDRPPGAEPLCGLGLPRTEAATASDARTHLGTLRCHLWVDTLGLVPAYVGLLLLFTLAWTTPRAAALQRRATSLPALGAGLADLLENGLTLHALDLLGTPAWTDTAMAGVRHASQAKWLLLALALAVLGHQAWHATGTAGRGPRRAAALACLAGALALPLGAWHWPPAIAVGMAAMVLGLALLAWRQWQGPGA